MFVRSYARIGLDRSNYFWELACAMSFPMVDSVPHGFDKSNCGGCEYHVVGAVDVIRPFHEHVAGLPRNRIWLSFDGERVAQHWEVGPKVVDPAIEHAAIYQRHQRDTVS